MSPWAFIPTCDDPMSCYTLIALTIIVGLSTLAFGLLIRWNLQEIRRLEKWVTNDLNKFENAISKHDAYIENTDIVINQIHVDIAVQQNSLTAIKDDIAEIKTDIKTLLNRS